MGQGMANGMGPPGEDGSDPSDPTKKDDPSKKKK
eukprot:CAMPEP_0113302072 /NCGR_PEP_ID=MMETSP0010_2-20120614/3039_1 /TAXON_ID=216773 ORGANISM="Corethron hystrix, Strain 308" /NCGR_SAMPLE_ID=MMETSP0010_2 /ASSEMBLY_ACC=CAM_ASM_000155 /LENGTH=33 /DNA_ID=CAMNT_0000155805 /DNA_START=111 /DNA_END=209 /DNA_ORIENTATION=+ /assembly_acc=CAM_ASM_000155